MMLLLSLMPLHLKAKQRITVLRLASMHSLLAERLMQDTSLPTLS